MNFRKALGLMAVMAAGLISLSSFNSIIRTSIPPGAVALFLCIAVPALYLSSERGKHFQKTSINHSNDGDNVNGTDPQEPSHYKVSPGVESEEELNEWFKWYCSLPEEDRKEALEERRKQHNTKVS
jgi:hypothetical protein